MGHPVYACKKFYLILEKIFWNFYGDFVKFVKNIDEILKIYKIGVISTKFFESFEKISNKIFKTVWVILLWALFL